MEQVLDLAYLQSIALHRPLPPGALLQSLHMLIDVGGEGGPLIHRPITSLAVDIDVELSLAHVALALALLDPYYIAQPINKRQMVPLVREECYLSKGV